MPRVAAVAPGVSESNSSSGTRPIHTRHTAHTASRPPGRGTVTVTGFPAAHTGARPSSAADGAG